MEKYCSIIFYEGRINIVETIVGLAQLLAEKDYKVTIFCRENSRFPARENEFSDDFTASTVYFENPSETFLGRNLRKLLALVKADSLIPIVDVIIFFLQVKIYQFKNARASKRNADLIIGVDINGLLVSLFDSILTGNKNTIFLSLELRREKIFKKIDLFRLRLARSAYKKVRCVLIQDEDRFKSLGKFNRYRHPAVFYLPNSPLGTNRRQSNDGNYFRRLFSLDEEKFPYIVAQIGMINDKVYAKELAAAFNFIDSGCALIFHERQKRSPKEAYLCELRELNSHSLFLSLDPVAYKDLDKIYSAINIGVAYYKAINENFAQIAKASGKLAQYLRHGKPVLMNDLDSLRKLNERYNFGVTIKNPADPPELKKALEKIIKNYDYYSANALICFEKEFDFRTGAAPFLEFIETLEY